MIKSLANFAVFGAVGLAISFQPQIKRAWEERKSTASNQIRWSNDGSHFIGNVSFDNAYKRLNYSHFTSPNGSVVLIVHKTHLTMIEKLDKGVISRKELRPDGNTHFYLQILDQKPIFCRGWTVDGKDIPVVCTFTETNESYAIKNIL